MIKNAPSRVWIEIDLKKIEKNFKTISKTVYPAKVMAVLKANAYGLGIYPIANRLKKAGLSRIGVAEIKESMPVKKLSLPIQIIGGLLPQEVEMAVRANIICPVCDLATAKMINDFSIKHNKKTKVHVLVDTGMGRLGIPVNDFTAVYKSITSLSNLKIEGIYSHFANANNPKHPQSKSQLKKFMELLGQLNSQPRLVHIANSDGINNFPASYFSMVRTGINLYGVFDLSGGKAYKLLPTLTLKTRLIAKRVLPKGHNIGYGCSYKLNKETLVGTIAAGYADGIPYGGSNKGQVLVGGKRCNIIGKISMDYITIDLTPASNAKLGCEVVIFGKAGKEEITVENWAKIKGSHPYDIICSLGNRVERVYLD